MRLEKAKLDADLGATCMSLHREAAAAMAEADIFGDSRTIQKSA